MNTVEKWLQDTDIRQEYEATKKEFLLSKLFFALMEEEIRTTACQRGGDFTLCDTKYQSVQTRRH